MVIEGSHRVEFEYVGRLADGTVFDTSDASVAASVGLPEEGAEREYEPLAIELGQGRLIEGLEEGLLGLEEGEETTITVPPAKGYGERQEERIATIEREEFDALLEDREPAEGLHVRTQGGETGVVIGLDADEVRVDFNHPLAGETLEFEVEILDVTEP